MFLSWSTVLTLHVPLLIYCVDTTCASPDLLCWHYMCLSWSTVLLLFSHRLLLQKIWDLCPWWATKENKLCLLNQKLILCPTANIRWITRWPVTTFAQVYSTALSLPRFTARSKWMTTDLKQYARKRSRSELKQTFFQSSTQPTKGCD